MLRARPRPGFPRNAPPWTCGPPGSAHSQISGSGIQGLRCAVFGVRHLDSGLAGLGRVGCQSISVSSCGHSVEDGQGLYGTTCREHAAHKALHRIWGLEFRGWTRALLASKARLSSPYDLASCLWDCGTAMADNSAASPRPWTCGHADSAHTCMWTSCPGWVRASALHSDQSLATSSGLCR